MVKNKNNISRFKVYKYFIDKATSERQPKNMAKKYGQKL